MAKRQAATKRFVQMAKEYSQQPKKKRAPSNQFDPGLLTPTLKRAFELARLNHRSPRDWQVLARLSIKAIYLKKDGRPKIWTNRRLRSLANLVAAIYTRVPNSSELLACRIVQNLWRLIDGHHVLPAPQAGTLLKRLQEAKKLHGVTFQLAVARSKGRAVLAEMRDMSEARGLAIRNDKQFVLFFRNHAHIATLDMMKISADRKHWVFRAET